MHLGKGCIKRRFSLKTANFPSFLTGPHWTSTGVYIDGVLNPASHLPMGYVILGNQKYFQLVLYV